jgi:hypothetical protein
MSLSGALEFGRYAFPPNRLGYCGPDDTQALFEQVSQARPDGGLVEMERRFEGAYPYLCLIARANRIGDPFDQRVVEAYWIGNELLDRVAAAPFYESLKQRFADRMKPSEFRWVTHKLELNARPHHNFHVFDLFLRVGMLRDAHADIALERMDACRISWGRVRSLEGADLVVDRPQLVLRDGKLALSEPRPKRVTRQLDGRGFVDDVQPDDIVSIHWDWACARLGPAAYSRLRQATARSLELANLTM